MTPRSPAQRSLDAETRGVEEGHRAFVQDDGSVKVVSDGRPGKHYVVTFRAGFVGEPVVFTCTPVGSGAFEDDHLVVSGRLGFVPCKHAAVAVRRLEREGLTAIAYPAGRWVATEKAAALTEARLPPVPEDPFAGLPK